MKKCKTCKYWNGLTTYYYAYRGACRNPDTKRMIQAYSGIIYCSDWFPQDSESTCMFYEPQTD